MENKLLLPFDFDQIGTTQVLTLPSKNIEALQRAEYLDTFGFWQSLTGLFGYMKINRLGKYTLNHLKADSGMWNQWKNCAGMTINGGVKNGSTEITPIPHYFLDSFCDDELLESCFESLIRWQESGDRSMLTPEATRYLNLLVRTWQEGAYMGLRKTYALANLHDSATVAYDAGATTEDINRFKSADTDLKSYLALMVELATGDYPNANDATLYDAADFNASGSFIGDLMTVYADTKAASSSKLQGLINSGGRKVVGNKVFQACIVVSNSFYNAVIEEYNTQISTAMTNGQRITVADETASGITQRVYRLDGMIIVPLDEINGVDEILAGTTHYFGIWASGNVSLGGSFTRLPKESGDVGLKVSRNTDFVQVGTDANGLPIYESHRWFALSQALLATAIADATMVTGHVLYVEPA